MAGVSESGAAVLELTVPSIEDGFDLPVASTPPRAPSLPSEDHLRQLKSRALSGTVFIGLATAGSVVLRLVNSIIFSHLFAPELFGLMALVTTIIIGVSLFSHLGLQESVIQNPRGDEPAFLNTAWSLQLVKQLGVFVVSIMVAWPAARFYHEPRMIWVVPAIGLVCGIAGFASPGLLSMARHIRVRELVLLELFSQFTAFVATVAWAWFSPTLWALVGGRLISEVLRGIASYWMEPGWRPKITWDRDAIREIAKFGRWILVGTAITFLASQSDRLILGKLVSLKMLALYGIAYAVSDMPRQVILQFCSKVGFPFIAKFMDHPRSEFRAVLLKYRAPVLLVGGALLAITISTGDLFLRSVYDQRYHGACWMIAILALGLWHTLLYSTIGPAIFALQKSHYNAIAQLGYCVTLFVALPLGFHYYGMMGAVVAIAASDLPMYAIYSWSAIREGLSCLRQDAWTTAVFAITLMAALELRHLLGFASPFVLAH